MSTFQYVRGSIGVCLVCLAHRLAVVVVVVAVKEKRKKRRNPLKRTPVGVIREETCNLPPDGVRFISVCVLAETMASFNSTTDVTVYRSASSPFSFFDWRHPNQFQERGRKAKGGKKRRD